MNNKQLDTMLADGQEKGQLSKEQVSAWLAEVSEQKKKENSWRQGARKIVALYEGYKRQASPFNILYSNTDTLLPALYNNTPRPAVNRRFKDKDPLGAAVAMTLNRALVYTMDNNNGSEPEFDTLAEFAILGALVPGQGAIRFKYSAEYDQPKGVAGTVAQDFKSIPNTPAEGEAAQEDVTEIPKLLSESVCGETIPWDRLVYGYAKTWTQVPWLSIEHHMTEDELKENFGALGALVKTGELEADDDGDEKKSKDKRKVAVVYELWNKADRTVMFLSPGLPDRELRLVEDPLGISGFFPMDEPLKFLPKLSSMIPQPIYELYAEQAEELNTITRRISAVMECLKVRGAYDSAITELDKVMKLDDGEMIAIENVQQLGDGKGLKDAIFLMPLSELVGVLQQLYAQRQQIKTVIYEITGISDILRGSSVASETATAQNIKNQWGTLRLKKMQKKVQKWVRNNVRIMAEIAAKKFSQETFIKITELPYVTEAQKQQAEAQLQQLKQAAEQQMMQAQQMAAQAQQMGQPPGPPPPPPAPPPQNLLDVMATPVWEEIIKLMKDNLSLSFRVDIETNSTIADDMAEDQKNVGELLNALSQFLNGVAPLIQMKSMPFDVAKSIMLGIVRKMQMGPEVEDQLEKMKEPEAPPEAAPPPPPPPPPPDPNIQLKQQAEAQKMQMEMQKMQMELEF